MFNKLKISVKIVLLVLILVSLSVIAESIISYYRQKHIVEDSYLQKLDLITRNYEHQIDLYFDDLRDKIRFLSSSPNFFDLYQSIDEKNSVDSIFKIRKELKSTYVDNFIQINNLTDLLLIDNSGRILYQNSNILSNNPNATFRNLDNETVDLKRHKFYVNAPTREGKHFYNYVTLPIWNKKGAQVGQIVCKFKTSHVFSILKTDEEMMDKESFELLAYKNHHQEIFQINDSLYPRIYTYGKNDPIKLSAYSNPINNSGSGIYKETTEDDEKKTYLAKWEYYKHLGVGMMVRIDKKDAYYELAIFNMYSVIIGSIVILISLIISFMFSRMITYPMLKLKKILGLVSKGVLPKELSTPLKDEIGDMISLINLIVRYLKKTAEFATNIGQGRFHTDFKPISNKDILGKTLVNMKRSLENADEKDNIRNWIVTGVAEIGEILRNNTNLKQLGYDLLEYTSNRIEAQQGAFYTVNSDSSIQMLASFAFDKKKHLSKTFKSGEGLIGQAFLEKQPIIRTEIPEDYPIITSGLLGEQRPNCIAVFPLITNDIVYGIMEFASFKKFDEGTLSFLEEISEGISRTIFYIKVNENTKKLLTESQRMSTELQSQQLELKKNAEAMEKAQVNLKETNQKLEEKISEVNKAQSRIRALLKNASEVIMILDKDHKITYVSPSAEKIIGYREEDLIGKNDLHLVDKNFVEEYKQMFDLLLSNKEETAKIELKYYKKTGDKVWLEVTGTNMLKDAAINGIVFNFQDITERIRAKEEERKKGQMQALSENSLDLITRIGAKNSKIYYVNPAIKEYTGLSTENVINKPLSESGLHKIIISDWEIILEKVKKSKDQYTTEMVFPVKDDHKVMQISAIPEWNEKNEIESILIVSHDITEMKRIENEIKSTNTKIQDSINYAENIQKAIIPDQVLLKNTFEESFIFFKPRDIVSGDFPWYYREGSTVFFASVDCTGHGVPGAMISFVGYFLLNNIVQNNTNLSSGEILDLLDKAVTNTFKQNREDSTIKDGMDINFCKLNLKNGNLEYSGAQRPLYYVKKSGILYEIKGNKFPIGGGSAYQKTPFTTEKIKLEKGDSVYIFSDGLPDQFGGDGQSTKFGPKRIKSILENNYQLPKEKLEERFEVELSNWMGDTVQTDDILLIGVQF